MKQVDRHASDPEMDRTLEVADEIDVALREEVAAPGNRLLEDGSLRMRIWLPLAEQVVVVVPHDAAAPQIAEVLDHLHGGDAKRGDITQTDDLVCPLLPNGSEHLAKGDGVSVQIGDESDPVHWDSLFPPNGRRQNGTTNRLERAVGRQPKALSCCQAWLNAWPMGNGCPSYSHRRTEAL